MALTTLSLFVTLAVVSVHAQSDARLNVNIPFEFSARNKVLPVGEYTVGPLAYVALRNSDCANRA